ncbi:MAG: hypothetical protein JWN70_1283 [Planctomycetaceae bacterium]|nr:hypothetical protein [Planctomycetaceae bacterium]
MSARQKLNQGYVQGCLAIAALIGAVCRSWIIFGIAAVVLIGLSTHSGEIRPTPERGGKQRDKGRRGPRRPDHRRPGAGRRNQFPPNPDIDA